MKWPLDRFLELWGLLYDDYEKKPASVMAICVVSSEGDVLTDFFANRKKNNAEVYCKILEDKTIPWMKEKAAGKEFVFQQDSAPAHTVKKTVNLLNRSGVRFWDKDLWPSNSPDLNPIDYYFWSRIEAKAWAMPHNTVAALKEDIKKAVRSLETAEITHAAYKFWKRVEAVIIAEGGHIEYKIVPNVRSINLWSLITFSLLFPELLMFYQKKNVWIYLVDPAPYLQYVYSEKIIQH